MTTEAIQLPEEILVRFLTELPVRFSEVLKVFTNLSRLLNGFPFNDLSFKPQMFS
jgi:hypothetical protein